VYYIHQLKHIPAEPDNDDSDHCKINLCLASIPLAPDPVYAC
jgi:hypothetical protein